MSKQHIAFLGPNTFAQLAAEARFGRREKMLSFRTVPEVFDFVVKDPSRLGVVPIENSSGGTIYDTVDRLVDSSYGLFVKEALSMNVRLALLGKDKKSIKVIYSHFAPLLHCENWLRSNYPNAKVKEAANTGEAVRLAAEKNDAAAIGHRDAASTYNLKVLEFPIESETRNTTQFFVLGHSETNSKESTRTSLVVTLPNTPGSLCDFLLPFKKAGVSLARIISRPIVGKPETYVFLIDVLGTSASRNVKKALHDATAVCSTIRSLGAYPVRETYES